MAFANQPQYWTDLALEYLILTKVKTETWRFTDQMIQEARNSKSSAKGAKDKASVL